MRTDRELLEYALNALNLINHRGNTDDELLEVGKTITQIQERLAEPEPEPFAWFSPKLNETYMATWYKPYDDDLPLYRHPRQPVRLSDEEILAIAENYTAPDRQDTKEIGLDGEPTGEFYPLTLWVFCSEELTAFARELLEEAR